MAKTIEDLEEVLRLHHRGNTVVPAKVALRWGDRHSEETRGRINAMPGHVGGNVDVSGIKWIASAPMNPIEHRMPRASALTVLNDPYKGFPLCVMDGTVISVMRTGGITGVAAKYLATKNSRVVGLIGAGVQNRTQLMALKEALPHLERIKVYDLKKERSEAFAESVSQEIGADVTTADRAEEAVIGSDVVVSATTAKAPIIKAEWVKEGMFIANVGGYETEFDVLKKADKIVVDDWYQVKHRGTQTTAIMFNEGLLEDQDIYANLGALVSMEKPGRENDSELIFFNPVGMGIEDIIVANRVYKTARVKGVGTTLELWDSPLWC